MMTLANQPAFPQYTAAGVPPGMTYRQWLAGQIMANDVRRYYGFDVAHGEAAVEAVRAADALISELEKAE